MCFPSWDRAKGEQYMDNSSYIGMPVLAGREKKTIGWPSQVGLKELVVELSFSIKAVLNNERSNFFDLNKTLFTWHFDRDISNSVTNKRQRVSA